MVCWHHAYQTVADHSLSIERHPYRERRLMAFARMFGESTWLPQLARRQICLLLNFEDQFNGLLRKRRSSTYCLDHN